MIQNPFYIGKNGGTAPINFGYKLNRFSFDKNLSVRQQGVCGVSWSNGSEKVSLVATGTIDGYPTPDLSKFIVVYDSREHMPPSNAVVYNADGSVKLILTVPKRLSKKGVNHTGQGELSKFHRVSWWQSDEYIAFDIFIDDSDFLEKRLLRMSDYEFDTEFYQTWRL
tara:strand:+ start:164 stop:664 length:501 start_codon:yes stop_codon:yes gene_type:complete